METSRTNKFIKNMAGSALLQIITVVTGFISPRLMLTAFGSEINGITTSITQFISYIALVEAGLSNATIFALYKPLADRDNQARDAVVTASKIAYYRIGLLFSGLSVILALVYPYIGHTEALSHTEIILLVLVLCSNSAMNFFLLAKYRTLLTADQCGYMISIASGAQLIVHLILVWIGIKLGFGVVTVRAMGMLSLFLTTLILAMYTRHHYPGINYHAKPNMKALDKRWDSMFLQIMAVAVNGAPMVIMTALLDFKQISVYGIYYMIAGSVATCITVFTSGLSASFGNIYASGDAALLKKTTGEFRTAFYMVMSVIYGVMICTLLPFIALYTKDITDVNYYLPLFGVLITLRGVIENFRAPHGMLIYSFGQFKLIRRQTITQTVLVVVLTFLFTKYYGLHGTLTALCIADLYMLVEMLILTPRKLIEMSVPKNIRQIMQVLAIIFGLYWITMKLSYTPDSYLTWVVYAAMVGMAALVVTAGSFFLTDRTDVSNLWLRAKILLRRKKAAQ